MNNDIRPTGPKQPGNLAAPMPPRQALDAPRVQSAPPAETMTPPAEIPLQPPEISPETPNRTGTGKKSRKKRFTLWFGVVMLIAIIGVIASYIWYQYELQPVSSDPASARIRVTIKSGTSPDQIATQLQDQKLIRSGLAFEIYTRLSGTRGSLQAGTYSLSPHESTPKIVDHLVSGKTDTFSIRFLPGATVADNRKILIAAGYSEADVDAALTKTYTHEVFAGKPAGTSLEGYIYGETYSFSTSATPEDILIRTFDELGSVIKANDLAAEFKKQGLSLYEGITLASIVQRETSSTDPSTASADQKQVAQVFYTRLSTGLPLGSDVTAYYGADLLGVPRAVSVDTPYNTRIHTGMPPGPIASPSLGAMLAVAHPASGNYVYFLSGDDDITYFAHTNEEHEQNIVNHCKVKCSIP